MKLIIAEKPDQAKKLAAPFSFQQSGGALQISACDTFPEGAVVVWALGHLLEPVPPEQYYASWKRWNRQALPMIPDEIRYRVKRRKEYQVIAGYARKKEITSIIHAGDAEREGEAIIRLILRETGVHKPLERLWISSLTPQAVINGFQTLRDGAETEPLFHEAVSRAFADWLVGMNATRVYTLLMQEKGAADVFSVGRVQTPTLCFVTGREDAIAAFTPEDYWEVHAEIKTEYGTYTAVYEQEKDRAVKDQALAEKIAAFAASKETIVDALTSKERSIPPPQLFSLSSLQSFMNKKFKMSPKETLDTAQRLYTKGYLSYPRTDAVHVTAEEAQQFPGILKSLQKQERFAAHFPLPKTSLLQDKRYVNPKKVSDHYAVIPTEQVPSVSRLSKQEADLYTAAAERLIAAHENNCTMADIHAVTLVGGRAPFHAKTSSVKAPGWKRVLPVSREKEQQDLTFLEKGMEGEVTHVDIRDKQTKPPKRFTEGDLIQLMKTCGKELDPELAQVMKEKEGLGTEATRAGILTTLKDRAYITVEKNIVYPTKKAEALAAAVEGTVLASPEMTAQWEQRLKEVGTGEKGAGPFLEKVKTLTASIVEKAESSHSGWKVNASELPAGKGKKNKKTYAKKQRPLGTCPSCGGSVVDKGTFFGCSTYRTSGCRFTVSKQMLGKSIPQKQIQKLLKEGRTDTLEGFQKEGRTFSAVIVWEKEKQRLRFDSSS
ncbi:type IA DNA topoisomerase [Alkalicoccus chagannorensis]|uniref:type IA DNA topoisomerase n=1 Tax=Alkalicoccus chagannorensis TaxID=427072 RepID=UPI00041C1618|nr:type IA DNA topoisomerase [Alkalicoccus chagannorensis]